MFEVIQRKYDNKYIIYHLRIDIWNYTEEERSIMKKKGFLSPKKWIIIKVLDTKKETEEFLSSYL